MREIRFVLDADGRRQAALMRSRSQGGSRWETYDLLNTENPEEENRLQDEEPVEETPEG